MQNIIAFASENWYWIIAAILILPTVCWHLLALYVVIFQKDGIDILQYEEYWHQLIKLENVSSCGIKIFHNNKLIRLMNLVSLSFIWGFIMLIIVGGPLHAVYCLVKKLATLLWKGIQELGSWLAYLWRQI